jgi:hypothetical protein
MRAADEMTRVVFGHDCRHFSCGDWMPMPPTRIVRSERIVIDLDRDPAGGGERLPVSGLARSLASGAAGALALTAMHELGRRRFPNAPRMDQVAMRGLRRILPGEHRNPIRLHQLALAGDLVANAAYYSVIPASTPKATWTRAAILGTAAGICALLLPQHFGLGAPRNSDKRTNQAMTIGWYLIGAVATALVATASHRAEPA